MKRPVAIHYILIDFLKELFRKTVVISICLLIIFKVGPLIPQSILPWLCVALAIGIIVILIYFLNSKKWKIKCPECSKIGNHSDPFCASCGMAKTPHLQKSNLDILQPMTKDEKQHYLKSAMHSDRFLNWTAVFCLIIPLLLGLIFDWLWVLLFIPAFIIFLFIIVPWNDALINRCPFCAHQTVVYRSRYQFLILNYCLNCGHPLKKWIQKKD